VQSFVEDLRATLPIRRVVVPADVTALAVHLMSNTALTGATFDIDGGQQIVSWCTHDTEWEETMEFLVEFDLHIPEGAPEAEVKQRQRAEAAAAAELAREGRLERLWKSHVAPGKSRAVGVFRADSEAQLDGLLGALPLKDWMQFNVTPLEPHPNDPTSTRTNLFTLPDPRLTPVYRLEATLGRPLDLGDTVHGHRRIVPLTGGTFTGPEISGALVSGASADWQTVLPDGTALGDIRYTLQTTGGDLLYVQSRSVRHGPAEVLTRLGRGEAVEPSEYTFRAATQIETGAPGLDWLNKGVFIGVAGRQAAGVIYETYLVG
jgi:muconolactone delta-isomerase